MDMNASLVSEILATLDELAATQNGPTVRERVLKRIEEYVDLVQILQEVQNPVDLVRLRTDPKFLELYSEELQMNDHIQTILFFSERGLIDCDDIPSETEHHVTHPVVQAVGKVDPMCFAVDAPSEEDLESEETAAEIFDVLASRIITSFAVRQILGKFNFWVDPSVICPTTYLSVHPLSSTIH